MVGKVGTKKISAITKKSEIREEIFSEIDTWLFMVLKIRISSWICNQMESLSRCFKTSEILIDIAINN